MKIISIMGILLTLIFSKASFAKNTAGKVFVNKHPVVFSALATYDIRSYGAVGDGKTVNTKAIQKAIDSCNNNGGGIVLVAGGSYITGTLYLKSNICLRVEAGASILGSSVIADYATNTDRTMYNEPYMDRCLIFARDAQYISIDGLGVIDGQGKYFPEKGDKALNRPKMIRFINCAHIRVRDITLRNPASWNSEWRYCSDIAIDGINISSPDIASGDGLDFDGCTKVRVSNSNFDTGDDAICLQTSSPEHPCQDIAISGCNFSSRWAGIRIGLLSRGNFENIAVNNCTFRNHNDSALKIQMMEGAEMKNMVFSNLVMQNVPRPVFLSFNKQNAWVDAHGEPAPMKRMYNMIFSNITVENTIPNKDCAFIITGMPDHPVEDITFSNIRAIFPGGGKTEDAKNILAEFTSDNLKGSWPEYYAMRATVPAYGMYLRHIKGIVLQNLDFKTQTTDNRSAVVAIDVKNMKITDAPQPIIQ